MAVNDVWQTVAFYRDGAETAQVVRHHRVTVQESEGDLAFSEAFLDKVAPLWQSLIAVTSTVSATLICLTAQKINPLGGRIYSYFYANAPGAVTGDANAAQLAVLISLYSDTPQPYARGRSYIPFPAETLSVGGVLTDTAAGNLITPINALFAELTDAEDNTYVPVVWSRKTSMSYDINALQLRPVLATQRRRRDPLQAFV